MESVLASILELLESKTNFVMATIVEQHGSTPRTAGTRFIIKKDGTGIGTIGGGQIEADVIKAAERVFTSRSSMFLSYDKSEQKLLPTSNIKSGTLSILLELIEANEENKSLYTNLDQTLKNRTGTVLCFEIAFTEESGTCMVTPSILGENLNLLAGASVSQSFTDHLMGNNDWRKKPLLHAIKEKHYWAQMISPPSRLTLFGAGHVSRATAALAVTAGIQTTVIDDRKDLLSHDYYDSSIELRYQENLEEVPSDPRYDRYDYIVIMSRSHMIDRKILGQVLKNPVFYIGMLGSRKKRDAAFQKLLSSGFNQSDLDRVCCPIGIKIGAETPQEIAVSIIAELIQFRSGQKSEKV